MSLPSCAVGLALWYDGPLHELFIFAIKHLSRDYTSILQNSTVFLLKAGCDIINVLELGTEVTHAGLMVIEGFD